MTSASRFAKFTDDELKEMLDNKDYISKYYANKYEVSMLMAYLKEMDNPEDFEKAEKVVLSGVLTKFYAALRNKNGEFYKRSYLLAIRSGLARHLAKLTIEIIKDTEFKRANDMFLFMCKLISKEGKGDVQPKRPIDTEDIKKLYSSLAFDINTPTGLLNKVWFELCMHFCRRGRENQREMKVDMFEFHYDYKGLEYVLQRSEATKNRQCVEKDCENERHKHPNMPSSQPQTLLIETKPIVQRPKDVFCESETEWYENRALGKNTLGNDEQLVQIGKSL